MGHPEEELVAHIHFVPLVWHVCPIIEQVPPPQLGGIAPPQVAEGKQAHCIPSN